MHEFDVFGAPLKIRYKGYFDWQGLYRLVYNWMIKKHFRYHEKRYKDKIDTALGNEIEVDVWGEKEITEYYRYKVEVAYHLWESREMPVVVNGREVKLMRGRIDIKLKGTVVTDWQKRYSGESKVNKLMEMFLNKVILKNEIEMKHIDVFDKDLHALEGQIKKFLKMESDPTSV